MCYPCTKCGACGKFTPGSPTYVDPASIICLHCGEVVDPITRVCPGCGKVAFSPPGVSSMMRSREGTPPAHAH